MKFIIKLAMGLLMPNLFFAYWIQNMMKESENETAIMTNAEIKFMYILSLMIVVVPVCLITYLSLFELETRSSSFFFNYIKTTSIFQIFFGIIASFIYLYGSKSFKFVKE